MIIAASPVYNRGPGMALRRIVLRYLDHKDEYVVHDQYFYSDGTNAFGNGDYSKEFPNAHARWMVRSQEAFDRCSHVEYYPVSMPSVEERIRTDAGKEMA